MSYSRKPPTMADIAREAGVSPMTVSRAFKAESYVNAETREAILKAADRLGYVLDKTAAGLSSKRTGFVAVTIPSINNANFADTVRGLTDGLRQHGLQVLLGYTNYDVEEEERLIHQLLMRRPEAIVVTGGVHTPSARRMLEASAIPVIETWDQPSNPIDSVVGFSNAEASSQLVRHLVETGRTKIAFIGGDTNRDTRGHDRRRGFVAEMKRLGLDSSRQVEAGHPPISMREGAKALQSMLEIWPDTQAIMCVSDLAAFGALTECQRQGILVPEQLAIAGFGAYEIAEICVPPITTVDPNCYEIGTLSAAVVADRIQGTVLLGRDRLVQTTPTLIVRDSTA